MAQARSKFQRIAPMEAPMFARHVDSDGAPDPSVVWENDCAAADSLVELSRHEATTRRTCFKALAQLHCLRAPRRAEDANRIAGDYLCEFIEHFVSSPVPGTRPATPAAQNQSYSSNPISRNSRRIDGFQFILEEPNFLAAPEPRPPPCATLNTGRPTRPLAVVQHFSSLSTLFFSDSLAAEQEQVIAELARGATLTPGSRRVVGMAPVPRTVNTWREIPDAQGIDVAVWGPAC